LRGDVAWIKVVHVLGKRFVIRVLEDGRRVDEKGMCGVYRGLMALNNWFQNNGSSDDGEDDGGSFVAVAEGQSKDSGEWT
jgi:hypothetical protein